MSFDIVVASGKGGVGKSLITSSLIYLLRDKYRVIGVDADAPAPNLGIIFNIERWDREWEYTGGKVAVIDESRCIRCDRCVDKCIYEAILPGKGKNAPEMKSYLCEGCRACTYACPVDAITFKEMTSGTLRIASTGYGFPLISARLHVGRPNSGKLVAEEREKAREMAENEKEVVIIDSAAGIGCEVIASITGTDLAILVVEPTRASLSDMARAYSIAEHFGIRSCIVINKYDLNPGFKEIERFAKEKGIETIGRIPYDKNIPLSLSMRKPMVEVHPDSEASKAIKEIAERVARIIDETL